MLDPTKLADWQIAEEAERSMKSVSRLAADWGILDAELLPYGHHLGKIDYASVLDRLKERPNGKYIDVTAITPTPLGEGKSTTTMGLVQGLAKRKGGVSGAIRQPSGGPTFNIKGSAAGGGLSQCIPLTPFSLGLTGDIDAVTNAHNLAMVAVTARLQHEAINTDEFLAKRGLHRLNIDPTNVSMRWVIDFCAQSLRDTIIGLGGKTDGFMMRSGFAISVSSEVMAILAVFTSLRDLRERIGRIVVAYDRQGKPVTTRDLEVDGAMTAWLMRASNPNLLQTMEGQPVMVHAGPFANIAVGQSSIVADQVALKLSNYHVTESGFGADIGFEKFWNIKCRVSGLKPNCAVIVATVRALKMHGGGPRVVPGKPLDVAYTEPNPALVEKGIVNLLAHIETVKKSGINPVVCINHFHTDSPEEIAIVRRAAEAAGARVAVSQHWLKGGEGALELADAVIDACDEPSDFKLLYEDSLPVRARIEKVAHEVYGADGVSYTPEAKAKAEAIETDPSMQQFATCMVKTHLSLSHDPSLKGRPSGWALPIRDILVYSGAGFIVPVAGDIKLMPGTSSDPAFRRIDVDVDTGRVKGLF
ncbi:formate--tetrahydrofolate ligase [Dehalogenimonas alkenigignens]|uniref:Formate--tetrahydrofolate ligase n=1 Tax=Dehalogenimonas alkenigignens TaxID=1217799 RepID=A0A0W0GJC0_9CHLR|nr:formate--tetrahydrofolate ligase [Dehalogenimonas alkenigignens]KTB48616.1 Formate-tetrahydrofolate ligase [Dehalogenimonas alkenigignens]PVV84948.1 formate--tetrahydrofolate ligase [Dehalogenimonas alkenigignens]